MKIFAIQLTVLVIISLNLSGCFHSSSGGSSNGKVTVNGNIKNETIAWHNYLPDFIGKAFAVDTISTRSTLTVTDPERLSDVSISSGIIVDADVINNTTSRLENYKVDVFVEDEQFLTKEKWTCNVCYPNNVGGHQCEGLWEVNGNNMFETDPAPTLELCQAGTGSPDLCVTFFPDGVNCSIPTYQVEYENPGNGLWTATINNITVEALSNTLNSLGVQSGGWIAGTNKYARFIVYNETSVEIFKKDYVFNVIP